MNYDPEQKYPLLVFLHGAGERGSDNESQLTTGLPHLITKDNRESYPCFIVAPQCPGKKPLEFWRETVETGIVMDVIELVENKYSIDPRRIYVTGLSDGGWGTFALLAQYPDKFAAAAPLCGGGAPRKASKYVDVPIWIFHGAKDDVEPVKSSRNLVEALKDAGGSPKYTEYPNAGHFIWDRVYQNPKLLEWLFAQQQD